MTDGPALPVYRIALIPGDGVGPEVVSAAVSVLEAAGRMERITQEHKSCDARRVCGCDL